MVVKVYMSCCGGDKVLDTVNEAIRLSGIDAQVETVKELGEIAKAGVMSMPAIKVNNRLIASGRIPKLQDLVLLLTNAAAKES
jgi:alkyl hydroperoxide reductase subunit AhpF